MGVMDNMREAGATLWLGRFGHMHSFSGEKSQVIDLVAGRIFELLPQLHVGSVIRRKDYDGADGVLKIDSPMTSGWVSQLILNYFEKHIEDGARKDRTRNIGFELIEGLGPETVVVLQEKGN